MKDAEADSSRVAARSSQLRNLLRVAYHGTLAPLVAAGHPDSARIAQSRRVNVPAHAKYPSGRVGLHAMDALAMKRVEAATWVFDELLDLDALEAGLERCAATSDAPRLHLQTKFPRPSKGSHNNPLGVFPLPTTIQLAEPPRALAQYPVVAGWARHQSRGGSSGSSSASSGSSGGASGDGDDGDSGAPFCIEWDAARAGRGALFVRATARGAPPAALDFAAQHARRLAPAPPGHALLAAQATHFPEACATLLAVSLDHTAADWASFMDFVAVWSRGCLRAHGAADSTVALAEAPAPVWDRSVLCALPKGLFSLLPSSRVVVNDATNFPCEASTWRLRARGLLRSTSQGSFWPPDAPQVWDADPFCRVTSAEMLARSLWSLAGCCTEVWRLPRATIAALKYRLAGAMQGGTAQADGAAIAATPTANDLIGAMLAAAAAWLDPTRVARRGGLHVNVIANLRG